MRKPKSQLQVGKKIRRHLSVGKKHELPKITRFYHTVKKPPEHLTESTVLKVKQCPTPKKQISKYRKRLIGVVSPSPFAKRSKLCVSPSPFGKRSIALRKTPTKLQHMQMTKSNVSSAKVLFEQSPDETDLGVTCIIDVNDVEVENALTIKTHLENSSKVSIKPPMEHERSTKAPQNTTGDQRTHQDNKFISVPEEQFEVSAESIDIDVSAVHNLNSNEVENELKDNSKAQMLHETPEQFKKETSEMAELAPVVIRELEKAGVGNVVLDFFRLVAEEKFPLSNIAFLLWVEVVQWYKQDITSTMRYMSQTKKFWKLGWRHFGGQFIRFMSGFKNTSDILFGDSERGCCRPEASDINFVVPSFDVLRAFTPYGNDAKPRAPGVYVDVMESVASALSATSACLTYDGKKLKQGLTAETGDVNILGFEEGTSLADRQKLFKDECTLLEETIKELKDVESGNSVFGNEMQTFLKSSLLRLIQEMAKSAQNIREIKGKKEYAKTKLVERSEGNGNDWRHGKYAYAISSINALLYDIEAFLDRHYKALENICLQLAGMNNCIGLFQTGKSVYLPAQTNYVELIEDPDNNNPRFIKQRSERWSQIRMKARVTGSTIYQALGLDGLKAQREHFEKVMCGVEKEKSTETKKAMEYGTANEINAIATLVGKILPVLSPETVYFEEGCITSSFDEKPFLVVSPDGSLGITTDASRVALSAVEFKCPTRLSHREIPHRYALQCLCTMEALGITNMFYVCWRPDITTVFQLQHNKDLYDRVLGLAQSIYGCDNPKRPSKSIDCLRDLKTDIASECAKAVFLGEFPSAVSVSHELQTKKIPEKITINGLISLYEEILKLQKESYELQRQKASEAMTFLCCDLDRDWMTNPMRWAPVCWFPKGYSLTTDTMRNIAEHVHTLCHKAGIHIPASSFDGQWHNIAVRSCDGSPLTLLQLQKDLWHEVEKMKKASIVKEFRGLNKKTVCIRKDDNGFECTNGGEKVPTTSKFGWKKERNSKMDKDNGRETESELVEDSQVEKNVDKAACEVAVFFDPDVNTVDENITDEIESNESMDGGQKEQKNDQQTYYVFTRKDAESVLKLLQTDHTTNKKGIWDKRDENYLIEKLSTHENIKSLRDVDLSLVIRYLKPKVDVRLKSGSKSQKIEMLCKVFGYTLPESRGDIESHTTKRTKVLKDATRASDLALKILETKVPKQTLNATFADYIWPERLRIWKENSRLQDDVKVYNTCIPEFWFYIPEYSKERKQLEVKCIDSTHLLTRMRRKSCKGGLDGISNQPWIKVAKQRTTHLTLVMVEDIIDPMSVTMALTHFSEKVESAMRENGDITAADLCNDIRQWWLAEDEPGIPAITRIQMRLQLRDRLLKGIDFRQFPPPTTHVNGWPIQLWEGTLANIDAKTILHALCKKRAYNVRAFSSMMGETFFSELTNNDRRGHGTVTAGDFAFFIGNAVEQMQTRLDPDRTFVYRTCKSTVYKRVEKGEKATESEKYHTAECDKDVIQSAITEIVPRDHFFDSEDRRRVKPKRKEAVISTDRNAPLKGSLGVRWEKARLNEAKILPTRKMGLSDV